MSEHYPSGHLRASIIDHGGGSWCWTVESYVTGLRVLPPWEQLEYGFTSSRWGARRKAKATLRRIIRERQQRVVGPAPTEHIYEEEMR